MAAEACDAQTMGVVRRHRAWILYKAKEGGGEEEEEVVDGWTAVRAAVARA